MFCPGGYLLSCLEGEGVHLSPGGTPARTATNRTLDRTCDRIRGYPLLKGHGTRGCEGTWDQRPGYPPEHTNIIFRRTTYAGGNNTGRSQYGGAAVGISMQMSFYMIKGIFLKCMRFLYFQCYSCVVFDSLVIYLRLVFSQGNVFKSKLP